MDQLVAWFGADRLAEHHPRMRHFWAGAPAGPLCGTDRYHTDSRKRFWFVATDDAPASVEFAQRDEVCA